MFSVLLGGAVLAGLWMGVGRIAHPIPGLPNMVPNTAEWFILLGTSLLLQREPHLHWPGVRRRLAQAVALVVLVLAATTLAEYVLGRDLWVDRTFSSITLDASTGFPAGRSAPGTSAAFVLLAAALLTVDVEAAIRMDLSEILAIGAALLALLAVAGYVYGATTLYTAARMPHTGMAPHTTVGLLVLSAGVVCVRPERALIGLVTSARAGGFAVRRLLVGASAVPAMGFLVMLGLGRSLYGEPFAAALLAVVGVAVAIGLVLSTGLMLDRVDAARSASERAVADREERLHDLIEQASDGIFIADLDGRFTEVNDAGCKMLGYRREDLIGRTIMDLIPADDIPRLTATKASLLKGGSLVDEWTLKRSDGTRLPVEVSTKILPDGRWQGLVRDISARWQVEQASETVAKALTGAPQSSVHAVLHAIALEAQSVADAEYVALGLDRGSGQPFEPWVFVGMSPDRVSRIGRTPRAVGVLGLVAAHDEVLRVADLRRHPAFAGFPPHHPPMTSFLGVPIRSRGRSIGNLYLTNKRGAAEFSVADQRAVERLAARAATIIETAHLYQAEGLERAWLQAVIDQMPEGVILADSAGTVHLENRSIQAFARDTGYDLRLSNGQPVPPDDHPAAHALTEGTTTNNRELALRHPDGRLVPMLVSAAPVFDLKEQLSGVVTIYQDVTTLKEIERLREEWSSVVAHDLRQPVSVIALDTQALAAQLERGQAPDAPKLLARIRESTRRLNKMINDLQDVSLIDARRIALECDEIDLASLLDDFVERLSVPARDHPIRFVKHVEHAPVFVDTGRIEQVLDNLISNAVKYGEPRADIRIELGHHDTEFDVAVISRGPGIAPADLPTLFQRFARGGIARGTGIPGLGLGLYICKGLVEAHGGRIWAESVPGETTFHVAIPMLPVSHDRRAPVEAAAAGAEH